ncbi:MAG: sulfur carrier protein ThiS [Candidatus Delongbacteria bacterium]|nr:sulfur carrier protein ThiS [Candidatus Delongbacteria bacterium]MBN2834619.1 sulfur carrier protein ThiS [Candidatus Delongbacteria bacterium]
MIITLNGESKKLEDNISIQQLLDLLNLKKETVVAELNGEIIVTENFDKTIIYNDAVLELIRFVGGG